MLLKLYMTTEKNIEYYQGISNGRFLLLIESIFLLFLATLVFVFLKSIFLILPLLLALCNMIIVPQRIKEANWESRGNSIKFRIERNIYILFIYIDMLAKKMVEKGESIEEAEKVRVEYVNRLINDKTQANITQLTSDVKAQYFKITGEKPKEVKSMDAQAFSKKKSKEWVEKYYPTLFSDIKNNEFIKNKTRVGGQNLINSGTISLDKELKILGLSTSTRDLALIKNRYYELVKKYHPDAPQNKNKDSKELQDKITEINLAYQEIEKALKTPQ